MQKRNIKYFFEVEKDIFYIDDTSNELRTERKYEKDLFNFNYFEAGKQYEANLESLIKYKNDFNRDADELSSYGINYRKYYSHNDAVLGVFNSKSTIAQRNVNMEDISIKEFLKIEKCSNGGLINVDLSILGKEVLCYGYDFSAFYANLLTYFDFKIPVKQGQIKRFKSLNFSKLRYGIYHVSVESEHPDFYKIFSKSIDNYHTHYALAFAKKYQQQFDIKMTVLPGESIVWEEDDLVDSCRIFGEWFKFLSNIKASHPKNKLVKRLMSSIWGSLCQYKRYFKTEDEFWELDVSEKDDDTLTEYKVIKETYTKEGTTYQVIKSSQPYSTKFGRMKPFLTSLGRCQVAEIIIENKLLEHTMRIHTDGIALNKCFNFGTCGYCYYPIPEAKTTGLLKFNNVNNYEKYCETCKAWISHTEKAYHEHF